MKEAPKGTITIEEAKLLQSNWIENQGSIIKKAQGVQDTREFLFNLDELQEYINFVKSESEEQGIRNPGLRIYFGAYEASEEKKGRATVFLAPTRDLLDKNQDEVENNYEIKPLNTISGGYPPHNY